MREEWLILSRMILPVLKVLGLTWLGYAAALGGGVAVLRRWGNPWLGGLLLGALLMSVYSYSRHYLIPYNADTDQRSVLLTGDEPDYLLTALSLARDGDINIANNIARDDYKLFQERAIGGGDFDFFNRISKGRIAAHRAEWGSSRYMQHRPGISVFLSPVFKFSEENYRWWSYFSISCVLVLAGVLGWMTALRLGFDGGTMFVVCVVCLLAPPVLFYANQVYPESVAGCLLLAAAGSLSIGRRMVWMAVPVLMGVIWFTDRALPVFAPLAIATVVALGSWRQRWAAMALLGLSLLLFGFYCQHRFGMPFPISHNEVFDSSLSSVPIRMFQIFFDNMQGWAWLFPPALLLPAILWTIFRQRPLPVIPLMILAGLVLNLAMVAAFGDWRGGTNPRGRYYVIPQLLMIPLLFNWFKLSSRQAGRVYLGWLIALGALALLPLFWLLDHPAWWFRSYHPFFGWEPVQGFYIYLPSLPDQAERHEWLKLLMWLPLLIIPSCACILADMKARKAPTHL